jgi:hypothetical protein
MGLTIRLMIYQLEAQFKAAFDDRDRQWIGLN